MNTKELTEKLSEMNNTQLTDRLNCLLKLKIKNQWDKLAIKVQCEMIRQELAKRKSK